MPENEIRDPSELENAPALESAQDTRTSDELDKLADPPERGRNNERAMKDLPSRDSATKKAPWEKDEFEYGGKKVSATREQILKWAQMGYDRPQAMQKFNAEKAKFEQERQKHLQEIASNTQKWDLYTKIDDFAAKNPDWWHYVQSQYQNRAQISPNGGASSSAAAPSPSLDPKLSAIEQKLGQYDQFISEWKQEKQQQAERIEDSQLEQEIQSIRQQHKDLDWDTPDQDGKSLELRVLDHAQAIGTKSFRAALRDLLHDDLLTRAQSQAKLAVAKGIQQKTRTGVLGTTPTPAKWNPRKTTDIRKTSYEDLEREIREELRTGRAG